MSLNQSIHNHIHINDSELFEAIHKKKYVKRLDRMVLAIGIMGPIFAIPQSWQIWTTHNVAGVNLFTWLAWLTFDFFWLAYGIAHRAKPIIITQILWILVNSSIILGIILFG